MSGTVEECLLVRWNVQLFSSCSLGELTSPYFHFRNKKWFMQLNFVITENFSKFFYDVGLDLNRVTPEGGLLTSAKPMVVSVQVESIDESQVAPTLYQKQVCSWSTTYKQIWSKELEMKNLRMTFCVTMGVHGNFLREVTSRSGEISIGGEISRRGQEYRSTSHASVQTSCTNANPISHCLESLSGDFAKLLDADSYPDVELQCEGHSIMAHKTVLCARSPALASMLRSDMVEGRTGVAKIEDMTNDTFKRFIQYLYTGKLDDGLTFESVLSLYEVGDMYRVQSLCRRCSRFLAENLTVENACDALAVADAHSDAELVEEVTAFILEKEMPLTSDSWSDFCVSHSILATKVLNRFCKTLSKFIKSNCEN